MKFVEFVAINPQNGTKTNMSVNPEQVCSIAPAVIPGEIKGPDGEKIGRTAALISFGAQFIIVDCNRAEVIQRLEEAAALPPLRVVKFPDNKEELNRP